jgi:hypothetical protein
MATCTVLTIRIDTNGAQRSASGAVFLDPAWSIPMIQITFPPVSAKFVRLSVNLPGISIPTPGHPQRVFLCGWPGSLLNVKNEPHPLA